jgi:hypothetical protein
MKRRVKRSRHHKKKWAIVNDRMHKAYRYELADPVGRNFDPLKFGLREQRHPISRL